VLAIYVISFLRAKVGTRRKTIGRSSANAVISLNHSFSEPEEVPMLLGLAIVLAIAWVLGFGVFHVASAAIHVLVVLALISLVLHIVRGAGSRRVT
jgi:hypothetical protein